VTTERLPPFVADILAGRAATTASEVRDTMKVGGIARISLGSTGSLEQVRELISEIGDEFTPVAMPVELGRLSATRLSSTGAVRYATNWHFDQSFAAEPPDFSALFAEEVFGDVAPTAFCDGVALFGALSLGLQDMLSSLRAEHKAYYPHERQSSDDAASRAVHPCVQLVEGDLPSLFIAPATVDRFENWSRRESAPTLGLLWDMMNWPEFTHVQRWQRGDLLVWPNCRYPHRALALVSENARQLVRLLGRYRTI